MKWKTLETQQIFKSGFVAVDKETCELPNGRKMPGYYILRFPDWVNVVPFTPEGEVILIKQYRHATKQVHWEIPGGAINPGEEPLKGAMRELAEETGYRSEKFIQVAENYPNPALQDNKIYTFIAFNCIVRSKQKLDPFEVIEVHKVSYADFRELIRQGKFNHNIVIASIYQAFEYMERNQVTARSPGPEVTK